MITVHFCQRLVRYVFRLCMSVALRNVLGDCTNDTLAKSVSPDQYMNMHDTVMCIFSLYFLHTNSFADTLVARRNVLIRRSKM